LAKLLDLDIYFALTMKQKQKQPYVNLVSSYVSFITIIISDADVHTKQILLNVWKPRFDEMTSQLICCKSITEVGVSSQSV